MAALTIRRATTADLPQARATLAAAFAGAPWTRWVVDPDDHERRLEELYGIYLQVALALGEVWVADDGLAVAAWTWSGAEREQAELLAREGLDARVAELSGSRIANLGHAAAVLTPHALEGEFWTLAAVGVQPAHQRRGLGSAVLAPTLARLDEEGRVADLETSAPDNVRLYERLGFRVRVEADMPAGGPHVWLMTRAPSPRRT
jgi:ribosomal protein S18 acetylase RimI-like enzyme